MSTSTKNKQLESVLSACSPRKLRALLRKYGYTVRGKVSVKMVNSAVAKYGDSFRVELAKIVNTAIRRKTNMNYSDGGSIWDFLSASATASQYWGIDLSGARKDEANAQVDIANANAQGDIANANAQGFLAQSSIFADQEKTKQILWTVGILAVVAVVIVLALRRKK